MHMVISIWNTIYISFLLQTKNFIYKQFMTKIKFILEYKQMKKLGFLKFQLVTDK